MPHPSSRRVLAIPVNGTYAGIPLAFQDGRGNREVWTIPSDSDLPGNYDGVYWAIADHNPTYVVTTNSGLTSLREGIHAVCVLRRIPVVYHAHMRCYPQRPYAKQYLAETWPTREFNPDEVDALAHLLTFLNEAEREHYAKEMRRKDEEEADAAIQG